MSLAVTLPLYPGSGVHPLVSPATTTPVDPAGHGTPFLTQHGAPAQPLPHCPEGMRHAVSSQYPRSQIAHRMLQGVLITISTVGQPSSGGGAGTTGDGGGGDEEDMRQIPWYVLEVELPVEW